MTLILSGTDGLSDVDGTAATPAIRGTDTNTGIFFPAADTIAFAEGGAEIARFDSLGNLNLTTGGSAFQWNNASNNCYIAASSGALQFATGTSSYVERMRIASDGSRSSVIPSGNTLYPAFDCRAWVNFNGTGTVAIRSSGNVSSITDNAVGNFRVNFTNSMPDANYAINVTNGSTSTDSLWPVVYIPNTSNGGAPTTTSCGINCGSVSGASQTDLDPVRVNVSVFR